LHTAHISLYTLSLHDALPILPPAAVAPDREVRPASGPDRPHASRWPRLRLNVAVGVEAALDELLFSGGSLNQKLLGGGVDGQVSDRKSTRLNSSHRTISYAVF